MSYYNKNDTNNPGNNETGKDVWQRQQDVLEHLKNAEQEIFKGIELQNPIYDKEYGAMRNHYSVSTLLTGARKYHFVIQSLLSDEKGSGLGSEKDRMYKQLFDEVVQLMNQASAAGNKTPIAESKLNKANQKIMSAIYLLREEVSLSELDFKKKKSVYDAWMD